MFDRGENFFQTQGRVQRRKHGGPPTPFPTPRFTNSILWQGGKKSYTSSGWVTEGKLPWGPLVGLNLLAYTDCGLYWIIIAGWMIHDYLSRIMDTLELKINHFVNILILFWGCQFWYFKFSLYYTNCWCQFRYFFPYLLFLGGYQLKGIPCIININIISYYGEGENELLYCPIDAIMAWSYVYL